MTRRSRSRSLQRALAVALALAAGSVCLPGPADARPGGGQSYKGGSRSKSSGGGSSRPSSWSSGGSRSKSSGGSRSPAAAPKPPPPPPVLLARVSSGKDRRAEAVLWSPGRSVFPQGAVRPAAWPAPNEVDGSGIGAFFLVLGSLGAAGIGGFVWLASRLVRRTRGSGWSTATAAPAARSLSARRQLEAIRTTDPDFSVALFDDFVTTLFTEAQTARATPRLDRLAPWLRPAARQALTARSARPATSVVIGAIRTVSFGTGDPARWHVLLEIDSNVTELGPDGAEHAAWVTERWWMSRARGARSRAPERARVLDCPGCGAPLEKVVGGACRHCSRAVDGGDLDWVVDRIEVTHLERRGPMLTGTTEERGTSLPTVMDPDLDARLAALRARDPAFDPDALRRRVQLVFDTMQVAWSSLAWDRARPFLSDGLFESQRYWIEAYRRTGLRNVTERTRIHRIDLARVTQDRWFDALIVRVHASGLDYTVRVADGAVVGGDRRRERAYTEYWTLLRGVGATGPTRVAPECPRCGAPFGEGMTVRCRHCGAVVNSAEHDWVLARIEQDEAYEG